MGLAPQAARAAKRQGVRQPAARRSSAGSETPIRPSRVRAPALDARSAKGAVDGHLGQGRAGLAFEIGLELSQKRGVGPEQRVPCPQAAHPRHLPGEDPVEMSSDVLLGRYLHMQSLRSTILALATISDREGDYQ